MRNFAIADDTSIPNSIPGSKCYPQSTIQTGDLITDPENRVVSVDDKPVRLTGKEYSVIELLALRKGTTLTKEMLLNQDGRATAKNHRCLCLQAAQEALPGDRR